MPNGLGTWEKQALLARGFKRVGRHSEYAIQGVQGVQGVQGFRGFK
jgi:hypothetical protein